MAATPDDPVTRAGRAADLEAALTAAEAAHLANRDTVRIERRRPEPAAPASAGLVGGRGAGRSGRAPLLLAAVVATGWAAVLSYAPLALLAVLAQLAEGGGAAVAALRLSLAGWLLTHGVPVDTGPGPVGLAPLTLTLFAAWRVARAGVHTSRAGGLRGSGSVRGASAVALCVGAWYALFGAVAATVVTGAGLSVDPLRAAVGAGLFGVLAGGFGAVRATGVLERAARRAPPVLRDAVRTGLLAAVLVLAAGAAAAGISLALAGGDAAHMLAAFRTGVAGQAGILLLCLAYAPNAAVWAAAYLIGPGFAVGQDTVVRTTEVSLGTLPAVPLFAGLPAGPLGTAGIALLALPVVAGMAAGWLLGRVPHERRRAGDRPRRWAPLLMAALSSGPVAGAALGLVALASTGPLGGDQLSHIGPVAWHVAVVGAAVVTIGALIGAVAARAATAMAAPA